MTYTLTLTSTRRVESRSLRKQRENNDIREGLGFCDATCVIHELYTIHLFSHLWQRPRETHVGHYTTSGVIRSGRPGSKGDQVELHQVLRTPSLNKSETRYGVRSRRRGKEEGIRVGGWDANLKSWRLSSRALVVVPLEGASGSTLSSGPRLRPGTCLSTRSFPESLCRCVYTAVCICLCLSLLGPFPRLNSAVRGPLMGLGRSGSGGSRSSPATMGRWRGRPWNPGL